MFPLDARKCKCTCFFLFHRNITILFIYRCFEKRSFEETSVLKRRTSRYSTENVVSDAILQQSFPPFFFLVFLFLDHYYRAYIRAWFDFSFSFVFFPFVKMLSVSWTVEYFRQTFSGEFRGNTNAFEAAGLCAETFFPHVWAGLRSTLPSQTTRRLPSALYHACRSTFLTYCTLSPFYLLIAGPRKEHSRQDC